ncbi:MAG: hypothetical protein A2Y92_01100 [Chloroflexi bacterium RBG_13_57_8]|nr:MAG: hypothetical protein A2Y92_01100 [Chloroflexi bacterium RBG_13_57_8]
MADKTKYGKLILRNAFKKHHQMEGLSASGDEMDADCILTHHVFYKPEYVLKESHYHDDFMQILCFLGTNPKNVRDFGGAVIEFCLGKEEEKHIIDSPAIVTLPKGTPHGPLYFKTLPKPVIFLEIMLTRKYHSNLPPPPQTPAAEKASSKSRKKPSVKAQAKAKK